MNREQAVTGIRLFDEGDLPWITELLDVVGRSVGEPWRVLVERTEHAALRAGSRWVSNRARQAILHALRRILGGRAERARIARRLRARILGHPALDRDTRDARIAIAAAELGIAPADVESLLWADLARERPVVLPRSVPDPRALAALANVDRIQREMRRVRELELRVRDHAHELVRLTARCGLITSVTSEANDGMHVRVLGPLSLIHATTVYGRALGAIVPLLAMHRDFQLDMHSMSESGPRTLRVETPVMLPAVPQRRPAKLSIAERLMRDLATAGYTFECEPAPIRSGDQLMFPDIGIDQGGDQWLLEVVGFSTSDSLADKLARYRAAGRRAILCVDAKRSPAASGIANVLVFRGRIGVADVDRSLAEAA